MSNEETFLQICYLEVAKELQFTIEGENGRSWNEEDKFTKDVFLQQAENAIKKYNKLLEKQKPENGNV